MAQKLRMCNLDLCFSFYRYFSELLSCTASVKGRHTGIIDRILKALALSHQLTTEKTKSHKHLHSLRSVMIICSCSTTFNLLRLSLPEGLQTSERDTLSFTLLWCARLWTNKPYLRSSLPYIEHVQQCRSAALLCMQERRFRDPSV